MTNFPYNPSKKIAILSPAEQAKTASGLTIPTDKTTKPEVGKVVAIGEGDKPIDFNIGDTVIYEKYVENKVFLPEGEFNFIRFKFILAVKKNK